MHEASLHNFFLGRITAFELAKEIKQAIIETGKNADEDCAENLPGTLRVTRKMLTALLDGVLYNHLPPEALDEIASILVDSEFFTWEDNTITEVLDTCATPEPLDHGDLSELKAMLGKSPGKKG